jgi:hypothetical protein
MRRVTGTFCLRLGHRKAFIEENEGHQHIASILLAAYQ